MAYSRTMWENSPSTATPISAVYLNNIEQGIVDLDGTNSLLSGSVNAIAGTAGTAYNLTSVYGSVSSTQGSVSNINLSLGSALGTISTNTAAIGSVSGTVTNLVTQPFGTVSGNYTIAVSDANKLIKTTSATAVTITLPPNGSVAFPIGQGIDIVQMAAGSVTFGTAVSGTAGTVTILSTPSLVLRTQNSAARIVKTDTNEWLIMGDML